MRRRAHAASAPESGDHKTGAQPRFLLPRPEEKRTRGAPRPACTPTGQGRESIVACAVAKIKPPAVAAAPGGAPPRMPRGEAAARVPRPPVARRSNHLTRFGVVFIGLALMIGMAAVNNGHNLLYLVFSVMLATLLVSGAIAFSNLRGLELERHYPVEFHVDQTVPGALRVANRKRLLASWSLRVVDFLIPEGGGRRDAIPVAGFCAIVRPGQAATIPVALHVPHRGVYRMVAMQAGTRYPYGLFQRTQRFDVVGQIVAYPRMLPRHLLAPMLGLGPGGQESERKGTGTSLFGVRNYQSGDPARLIHWKQSAKGQGMKLKEFEEEALQASG